MATDRTPAAGRPPGPAGAQTVVAEPTSWVVLVWILFPLLGAALLWLVQWSAGWIASLPWIPMRGPFKLIDAVDEPWATGGALLLGPLAGLVVAGMAAADRLTVTVAADRVTLARGDTTRHVERDRIDAVFQDGKQLVLLDATSQEVAREASDLPAERLRGAFEAYGYRWHAGGDPYRDDFRPWSSGTPELPPWADALLRARQRALDKRDRAGLADVDTELTRLGLVIRDDGRRQYWRRTRPAPPAVGPERSPERPPSPEQQRSPEPEPSPEPAGSAVPEDPSRRSASDKS